MYPLVRTTGVCIAAAALTACTLAPRYERPPAPVPREWPADTATGQVESSSAKAVDQIGWQEFIRDPRLVRLVRTALENNRNLRIAVLSVAASEAQFRAQRGNLFPTISASGTELAEKVPSNGGGGVTGIGGASGGGVPAPSAGVLRSYSAGIGFTNYELDLFGRQQSLTTQAFESYLAQSEARRSTQISLVAEVATGYFAVLADQALVQLTIETLRSETESYELTRAMYERDVTTLLSLRQAESAVDAARASLAQYRRQLAQDMHALALVLGQEVPADLIGPPDIYADELLAEIPEGLPSDLLTRRPDIMGAEHSLRAANANIGAARAAFLPSIQLTASGGTQSNRLGDLFGRGTGTWSFSPAITLPIFAGGRNLAGLDLAHIEKNIAIAQYEATIQTAFREVSDALSARGSYVEQRQAQEALVAADAEAYRLAQMRFRSGVDSYLATLDAQRSLYAAQQGLVSVRQAELTNKVTLYKVLGGGWAQHAAPES